MGIRKPPTLINSGFGGKKILNFFKKLQKSIDKHLKMWYNIIVERENERKEDKTMGYDKRPNRKKPPKLDWFRLLVNAIVDFIVGSLVILFTNWLKK